jgi:hypothetical protein
LERAIRFDQSEDENAEHDEVHLELPRS